MNYIAICFSVFIRARRLPEVGVGGGETPHIIVYFLVLGTLTFDF